MNRDQANGMRYDGSAKGHYESWFQRANHPTRPLAFWIRYTIFSPKGRAKDAVGELWAIWFDGEKREIAAVKEVLPFGKCEAAPYGLRARFGTATLDDRGLSGQASSLGRTIAWRLEYDAPMDPLLLFTPERLYSTPLPKAKGLVGAPLAVYRGVIDVDGEAHALDGWVGSQNHNWGSKHTDRYAWGQIAGFDGAPQTFLEVMTLRLKLGPIWSPWLTIATMRHDGREYRFNDLGKAMRARAHYEPFTWTFESKTKDATLRGRIEGAPDDFVGLPYDNPPGGRKTCLNSKIARAEVVLERPGEPIVSLLAANRAAFEILTDADDHGVPVLGV